MKKNKVSLFVLILFLALTPFLLKTKAQPTAFIETFNSPPLNTTIWEPFGNGSFTFTGGLLIITNGTNTADGSANATGLISIPEFATGTFTFKISCENSESAWGLIKNIPLDGNFIFFHNFPNGTVKVYIANFTKYEVKTILLSPLSGLNEYKIKWSLDKVEIYVNGLLLHISNYVPLTNLKIFMVAILGSLKIDYVTVGAWLSEQTVTATRTITSTTSTVTTMNVTSTKVLTTTSTSTSTFTTTLSRNTTLTTISLSTLTWFTTTTSTGYAYASTITEILTVYRTSYVYGSTVTYPSTITYSYTSLTIPVTLVWTVYNTSTKWNTEVKYAQTTRYLFLNYSLTDRQHGLLLAGMAMIGLAVGAIGYHVVSTGRYPEVFRREKKPKPPPTPIQKVKPPSPPPPPKTEEKKEEKMPEQPVSTPEKTSMKDKILKAIKQLEGEKNE